MVEIDSGVLRGRRHGRGFSFLGIPYAAETSGAHRFQAPRPVAPWAGVRDALHDGDRCPQTEEGLAQWPVFSWYGQSASFSENCCVLNIFVPGLQRDARRPVIVYLHGGGYASGGGGGPALEGNHLAAAHDLVVVTVNHRLNAFGYTNLAHLDADLFRDAANVGHLDLVAALGWVRRNIGAFGGDPDNVTLVGQSGGGNKAMVLLAMPAARGLFKRVVNMSGVSGLQVAMPDRTEAYVDALLTRLGIGRGQLRKLQHVPAAVLLAARRWAIRVAQGDGAQPIVDGRHVLESPFTEAGLALHADVPLLIGVTDTESTLFLGADRRNFSVDDAELRARICAQFDMDDAVASGLVSAYRRDGPQRTAADILAYLTSDVLVRGPLLQAAEAKANVGRAPVYLYHFAWKVPAEEGVWRTPHTADIPFVFGTVDCARAMTGPGVRPMRIATQLMAAIAAFARNGSPGNEFMPSWSPYEQTHRATMVVDVNSRLIHDFCGAGRRASAPLLGMEPSALRRGPLFRRSADSHGAI